MALGDRLKASEAVMACWQRGFQVPVTESETAELIRQAESPRFVPLTFDSHGVRLWANPRCKWAYEALSAIHAAKESA